MNAVLLALAVAVGAPGVKDKPKAEPNIVGEWTIEKNVAGGRERPPGKLDGMTYVFTTDGKYLARRNGVDVKDAIRDYKVDPKTDPSSIDLSTGVSGTPMVPGICKVEGDALTIAYNARDFNRPKTFESIKGSHVTLTVYKRVKKKE